MKIHPDVLAAHAQFGGDLESMQKLYEYPLMRSALERIAGPRDCGCSPVCQCNSQESLEIEVDALLDIAIVALTAPQLHQYGGGVEEYRYEIKYGPEGEENYAWLYRGKEMVATMRTHHALAICSALAHQALSVPFNTEGMNYNCPCAHPIQSDVSCSRAREGGTE